MEVSHKKSTTKGGGGGGGGDLGMPEDLGTIAPGEGNPSGTPEENLKNWLGHREGNCSGYGRGKENKMSIGLDRKNLFSAARQEKSGSEKREMAGVPCPRIRRGCALALRLSTIREERVAS